MIPRPWTFQQSEVVRLRRLLETQFSNGEPRPLKKAFKELPSTDAEEDDVPLDDGPSRKKQRKLPGK